MPQIIPAEHDPQIQCMDQRLSVQLRRDVFSCLDDTILFNDLGYTDWPSDDLGYTDWLSATDLIWLNPNHQVHSLLFDREGSALDRRECRYDSFFLGFHRTGPYPTVIDTKYVRNPLLILNREYWDRSIWHWQPSPAEVNLEICDVTFFDPATTLKGSFKARILDYLSEGCFGAIEDSPIPVRENAIPPSYQVPDRPRVEAFLALNPFLTDLLSNALPMIEKHFGTGIRVGLEVVEEPEAPRQEELFGFVHTKMSPEEALRRLDAFDREWWLSAVQRAQGKLNFSLRYD